MLANLLQQLDKMHNVAGQNQSNAKTLFSTNQKSSINGACEKQPFLDLVRQLCREFDINSSEDGSTEQFLQKAIDDASTQSMLSELLPLLTSPEKTSDQPDQTGKLESLLLSFQKEIGDLETDNTNELENGRLTAAKSMDSVLNSKKEVIQNTEKIIPWENVTPKNDTFFLKNVQKNELEQKSDSPIHKDEFNLALKVQNTHSKLQKEDEITQHEDDSDKQKGPLQRHHVRADMFQKNVGVPQAEITEKPKIINLEKADVLTTIAPEKKVDGETQESPKNNSNTIKALDLRREISPLKELEAQIATFSKITNKDPNSKSQKNISDTLNRMSDNKSDMDKEERHLKLTERFENRLPNHKNDTRFSDIKIELKGEQIAEKNSGEKIETNQINSKISTVDMSMDAGSDSEIKPGTAKALNTLSEAKFLARSQPLNQNEIIQQVIEKSKISANKEHNEITIKLKPEILGNIRLNISTENQQVTIKIMADSSMVKEVLENNLHQLKHGFVSQGLEIGSFDVSVGDDSQAFLKEHNFSGFQRNRRRMAQQKGASFRETDEEIDSNESISDPINSAKDRIDYYV